MKASTTAVLILLIGLTTTVAYLLTKPDPLEKLVQQLGSTDSRDRYKAAKDLEDLGPNAVEALDALVIALGDQDRDVRYRAVKAVSRIGTAADQAVPALITNLQDEDQEIRYYSKTLAKIGKGASPARDAMLSALPTSEPKAQVYLLESLGDVGEDHQPTIDAIKKMCNHRDDNIRKAAKEALEDVLD